MTFDELKAAFDTPDLLMRRCYIHIVGGVLKAPLTPNAPSPPANGQAEIATFKIELKDTSVTGFTTGVSGLLGKRKSRVFVRFTKQAGVAKATPNDDEINAWYVPMVQTDDVAAKSSHYVLPTTGEPTIMLTGKLSGCRFGIGSDATGSLLVSHVRPDLRLPKANRQADLTTRLKDGFSTWKGSFGLDDGYKVFGAVIGKRNGARWRFYCQASTMENQEYSINSTTVITHKSVT